MKVGRINKKKIAMLATGALLVLLLTFKTTVSLLMDHESNDNIITIGKVDLEIVESTFPSEKPVLSAGSKIGKDPVIRNTGLNDEYVFIKVTVPKRTVNLLYEQDTLVEGETKDKGTRIESITGSVEIFKTIADAANADRVEVNGSKIDPAFVIGYRRGDEAANPKVAGWVYLENDLSGTDTNVYYFGYNKKLLTSEGKNETVPLFDYVQLKSFIDHDMGSDAADVDVTITAYGIQAGQLGIDGLPDNDGIMTDYQVTRVFDIVKRKQGIS